MARLRISTAVVAVLFALCVPGTHAAYVGSAAAAPGVESMAAGSDPDHEIAFNATLTLAGIGLLCLVVQRRRSSGRRG